MSKMRDSVGVYYAGQDFSLEAPAFHVDRDMARQWIQAGAAWSIHHGRDIAVNEEAARELKVQIDARQLTGDRSRAQSQVMGQAVMEANAERKVWAMRLTRGWNPRIAWAEHARSLERRRSMTKDGGAA